MWHRPAGLALAAVLVALIAVPARGEPAVVGYIPPRVTYGALADGGELAAGQLRAQGLVVANLEPTDPDTDADTGQAGCPTGGCGYQLIVTDPAAVRAAADDEGTAACGTGGYGVVDADPDVADVDGARHYTAHGQLPTHTAETATAQRPRPMTAGVGQLCFAATTTADGEPVAVTQPVPVVILSAGHPGTDRAHRPSACDPGATRHPAQRAASPPTAGILADPNPPSDGDGPPSRCGPRRLIDILVPTTL